MVIFVLVSLLMVLQPDSTSTSPLVNQAKGQATYYVNQIERGKNEDIHLWALTELCSNEQQPSVLEFINSKTENIASFKRFKTPFCSNISKAQRLKELALETGSFALLLASVLEEKDSSVQKSIYTNFKRRHGPTSNTEINYDSILNHILNGESIGPEVLPIDRFYFAHFLLLYKSNLVSQSYLNAISEDWYPQSSNLKPSSLKSSLFLVSLVKGLYRGNEYAKILQLYNDLASERLLPFSEIKLKVYTNWDYSMYKLRSYDKGLTILREHSIPLAKFLEDEREELNLLQTQGTYLLQIGKIQKAQEIYYEVLKRSQEQNISVNKSRLYTNIGITHLESGNFDKYLELQFQALELAESEKNYDHQLKILQNLHIYYRRNDDIKSSLRYINEARNLSKEYGNIEDLAAIYVSLGVFYRDLKSAPDSAARYFEKADSVINRKQNFHLYLKLLTEKARLYEFKHEYKQALNIYRRTKEAVSSQKNAQTYLDALVDETRILLELGALDKVKDNLNELDNSDLSLLGFSELVKANTLEANYLVQSDQDEEAYQILKPTINQVVERAQSSTDLQSGFWSVEQEYLEAFKLYVDLLIETDRSGEAALALDKLKTINDAAFYQDPMVKASRLNESELTQYRQLTNRLDQLRKQKLSASSNERIELQNKIDRLNAQKRVLDRKITQFADQPSVNLHQVQQQLSSNDLILHITELKGTYYLAKISRRNVEFKQIPLDEKTRSLFKQSIEELSKGKTDLRKLYQISKTLGISELPLSAENIILIPDSYLFQLPMDILPLTEPSKNYSYGESAYFIERYRTEYLTSLKELLHGTNNQRSFAWDYVGFGISQFNGTKSDLMPLPYAGREVTQISQELSNLDQHRTILEERSTEEAFRETAPKARILHLATHSKVSEQDPLFSRIYMSSPPDQTEQEQFNSQIFAYELFEMNLSNDLIMLNSCESGSGSYLQGSGIVGISRALRYAGAESLVLNLWSVNDMMASDFATQFYKALNQGDTKSEALRKAKVYFLKNKNANPHYWGPYMLIGSNSAVVQPHRTENIYFATGFMLYLVVMVGLSLKVQRNGIRGKAAA